MLQEVKKTILFQATDFLFYFKQCLIKEYEKYLLMLWHSYDYFNFLLMPKLSVHFKLLLAVPVSAWRTW